MSRVYCVTILLFLAVEYAESSTQMFQDAANTSKTRYASNSSKLSEIVDKLRPVSIENSLILLRVLLSANVTNPIYDTFNSMVIEAFALLTINEENAETFMQSAAFNLSFSSKHDVMDAFMGDHFKHLLSAVIVCVIHKDVPLKAEFLQTMKAYPYTWLIYNIDLHDENDVNEYVETIKDELLRDRFKDVKSDFIDFKAGQMLSLFSSGVYNELFLHPFDPRKSTNSTFFNYGTQRSKVEMMKSSLKLNYSSHAYFDALCLPYKNGDFLLIILPSQYDGYRELLNSLNFTLVTNVLKAMKETSVHLEIPKFFSTSTRKLDTFQSDENWYKILAASPFDGISHTAPLINNLQMFASIRFYENGTQIKTQRQKMATNGRTLEYRNFIANHPFVFLIFSAKEQIVLYSGVVTNVN